MNAKWNSCVFKAIITILNATSRLNMYAQTTTTKMIAASMKENLTIYVKPRVEWKWSLNDIKIENSSKKIL